MMNLFLGIYYRKKHVCQAAIYSPSVKQSASNAGDPGSIPGLGRSPREGNGNPLQYSCLGELHGREA